VTDGSALARFRPGTRHLTDIIEIARGNTQPGKIG
jgi:hypothetical protein